MSTKRPPRQMGRPPASSFSDTRERILSAAERLFAHSGYEETSTKDLAEAAGLTSPALYHYFDSKESLFLATVEDRASKFMARFEEGPATHEKVLDKLCALLDVAVRVNKEDENISLFVSTAVIVLVRRPELSKRLQSFASYRPMRDILTEILEKARDSGELDPDTDIEGLTDMLDASLGGMAQFAGLAHTAQEHERAIGMFKKLLCGQIFRSDAKGGGPRTRSRRAVVSPSV